MAIPQPDAEEVLLAEIARSVPGAEDARRVKQLLSAWWRYAGVRNAAGAVVDSERFLAERSSLGLLELPVSVARSVIELEFAILNQRRPTLSIVPAPAAELEVEAAPDLVPDFDDLTPARAPASVERARAVMLASLVVFFSLAVGAAMLATTFVGTVHLPGGAASLVAPWRAWLAITTGLGGVIAATLAAVRVTGIGRRLVGPRIGLGGLAVTGVGLLGGSIATAGVGGAVLCGGAALGALRRDR
jgi:hypothetical protein